MNEETLVVGNTPSEPRPFIKTGFDLLVISPDGRQRRQPLCYARVNLGSPGEKFNDILLEDPSVANRQATLQFIQGKLYLNNLAHSLICLVNGQPSSFRGLEAEDEVQVGSYRIRILPVQEKLATLESYTDRTRTWPVTSAVTTMGRAGKRENSVELDDPTVSRNHASIHHRDGQFYLESESPVGLTRVNGTDVTVERPCPLSDGDLIQVGQQFLRIRLARRSDSVHPQAIKDAAILFSDIWDYAGLLERLPLEELIHQMNELYGALSKVILAHSGVLMSFLGDAITAIFGADEERDEAPAQAVRAALAMQHRLSDLNAEWKVRGLPTLQIGIGIHTDEVRVVDVDDSNLAARLENLTRQHEAGIIVSVATQVHLGSEFKLRRLGSALLSGRGTPQEIFQVLA